MDLDVLQSIDPRALGRRLQQARKARGRTQQEAADLLGVARTTLTAIEQGGRRIQPPELARLAGFYGRSVGEFLRPGEPVEALAEQLRAALAPAASVEAELAPCTWELQRLCEDYLELEQLCGAPLLRQYPPPCQIQGIAPEAAAEDVASAERNRLGLGDGPLLNLRELLEHDVGLRIFHMDLPARVAAMFAYTEQLGGCIAVNGKHPEERRRLSLGHEYGHFLTRRYKPEIALLGRHLRQPELERFADTFARAFLMPAVGLSRRFNELRRSREGRTTPADLCVLAHVYFVSVEALALRLEELRLLPTGTWDRLQPAGFRVREAQARLQLPQRPAVDWPLPRRYLYLAAEAFERGDLSEGQFARLLRVDRLEARRLAAELASSPVVSEEGTVEEVPLELGLDFAHARSEVSESGERGLA
ncbi:MAG: ImmA/IrrE family metallo-endopeptidase [Chloroflexi bacterium]|nr:ImmA/IrrE family metallo-endopeptidase [Chloroflexota bacterium]